MPRIVSIITAVHAPSGHYLPEAYKSLLDQEMPPGWDWQWVIQEDGETRHVADTVPDDPRISFDQGRHGGPGVARTLALARAKGTYLKVLDSDDLLLPGALAREIGILDSRPDIGWTTCRALDLLPDGSTVGFDADPPAGPLERGSVLEHWKANNYRLPVIPGSLCARRELVLALGGWMALPASEDTGLVLALSAVSRGWFIGETGLYYRKWPGQVTGQEAHNEAGERAARMGVAEARARILASSVFAHWRYPHNS